MIFAGVLLGFVLSGLCLFCFRLPRRIDLPTGSGIDFRSYRRICIRSDSAGKEQKNQQKAKKAERLPLSRLLSVFVPLLLRGRTGLRRRIHSIFIRIPAVIAILRSCLHTAIRHLLVVISAHDFPLSVLAYLLSGVST